MPGQGVRCGIDRSVPNRTAFPTTQVDACYDDQMLQLRLTAYDEVNFFFDPNQTTNDAIYNYEVMEAFLARGTNDPATYLEFEVSPNNVTFHAFIYNRSKVRTTGLDTAFITKPPRRRHRRQHHARPPPPASGCPT